MEHSFDALPGLAGGETLDSPYRSPTDFPARAASAVEAAPRALSSGLIDGPHAPAAPHLPTVKMPSVAAGAVEVDRDLDACLTALASDDRRVVVVNVQPGPRLSAFARRHRQRYFEIPAGDANAFSWCASLADSDCRPHLVLTSDLFSASWGSLVDRVCRTSRGATILLCPPAAARDDSRCEDTRFSAGLAELRLLPATVVAAPGDMGEAEEMLRLALAGRGPLAVLLPLRRDRPPGDWAQSIEWGHALTVVDGCDVALLTVGGAVSAARRASEILSADGIGVTVVHARYLEPLDESAILAASGSAQAVVIVEESSARGGFSSMIFALLARHGVSAPISLVSIPPRRHIGGDERAAADIVARCAWLADPVALDAPLRPDVLGGAVASIEPVAKPWLTLFSRQGFAPADERSQVHDQQPSRDVLDWMNIYLQVGRRGLYFWKWCVLGAELTTLPCVTAEHRWHVCETKVLSIMLCVLLDDVADRHGKEDLLAELMRIIGQEQGSAAGWLSAEDRAVAGVAQRLSDEYQKRIQNYPRYGEFAELLQYDLLQYFNTMRYSHLLNQQLTLLNVTEHELYMPHAMHMMSFATLDLMCTACFDRRELGKFREAVWRLQCMGRIGNLLSTWRREIGERDFNSGVFARAVTAGDLTVEELQTGDRSAIEAAIESGGHEQHFYDRWWSHRRSFQQQVRRIESVELSGALVGHDRFFRMHLDSLGMI